MNYLFIKRIKPKTYHKDIFTDFFNTQEPRWLFSITPQTKPDPPTSKKSCVAPILSILMRSFQVSENELWDLKSSHRTALQQPGLCATAICRVLKAGSFATHLINLQKDPEQIPVTFRQFFVSSVCATTIYWPGWDCVSKLPFQCCCICWSSAICSCQLPPPGLHQTVTDQHCSSGVSNQHSADHQRKYYSSSRGLFIESWGFWTQLLNGHNLALHQKSLLIYKWPGGRVCHGFHYGGFIITGAWGWLLLN